MLFERAPLGVFHYDNDMRITDCNERLAIILGRSREDLVGSDIGALGEPRVLPAIREALAGSDGEYGGIIINKDFPFKFCFNMKTFLLNTACI